MIYDFNMKGVTIPPFFAQNAKFNSFNSCGVQLKRDYLKDICVLYLKVGKKYYMLRNQSHLVAFKVLGVGITRVDNPCCGNYDLFYKVMYPNGKIEWLNGYDLHGGNFCSFIFESEEKFYKYVETNNSARYMYLTKLPILTQFMKFCGEDNILDIINDVLTYPCYEAKRFRVIKSDCRFNALWLDEGGLHFQAILKDKSAYDSQQYPTKEECEASLSITDFDDETDSTKNVCDEITICIKGANKNEVIESITKLGLNVNWVLSK